MFLSVQWLSRVLNSATIGGEMFFLSSISIIMAIVRATGTRVNILTASKDISLAVGGNFKG